MNATNCYYFPPPGMNETMHHLNDHTYYLESIAELIKIFSSIEHQHAETYP